MGVPTVWVRTDRNVTVLVEGARMVEVKGENKKGGATKKGLKGMNMGWA